MADVETAPSSAAVAQEEPSGRRVRRRALLALVAVTAASAAGWWTAAERRLDDVHLGLAPGGVRCDPGTVTVREDPFAGPPVTVIATRPGMRCTVQLIVRNASGSTVHLGELVMPVMGPHAMGTAQITGVSPFGATPTDEDAPVDAIVDLDVDLPAGQVQEILLHLEHRPNGCGGPGSFMTLSGPALQIKALGRTAVLEPALPPFALEGSAATDCSS